MPEPVKEPTVSVHGVPQSQFESGNLPGSTPQGGGKKKWILWIGLGIVGVIVLFMLFSGGGTSSTTPDNPSKGTGSDNANIDAELQKLQSEIDQLLADKNKKQPPPKKKKKKKDGDGDLTLDPGALHHILDTHGFAPHQKLG
jgi:hypothetical protein